MRFADTATGLVPEPTVWAQAVVLLYSVVVPHWNSQLLIVAPPGLTVAFNVAVVCDRADAGLVTTVGGVAWVEKVWSVP